MYNFSDGWKEKLKKGIGGLALATALMGGAGPTRIATSDMSQSVPSKHIQLIFDNKTLRAIDKDTGDVVFERPAVSGRPGFQSSEFTGEKGVGPIPEGKYFIRPDEFQDATDLDMALGLVSKVASKASGGKIKFGGWPGGPIAWGRHRVDIHPREGTDTKGRDNMSIHGGWSPGSAGCIDLTSSIGAFRNWLKSQNLEDPEVDLLVDYGGSSK